MEEMMNTFSEDHNLNIPMITNTTYPTWKLYENPFYIFQQQDSTTTDNKQIHRLHLPISARKIAASFWDLTFIKPLMESELAQIKAELESERRARKKMESLNKRLAREVAEERRVCQELAKEISAHKAEMSRMKRDMDDERKMLRTAEVIREERVQMKLSEAKHFLEEKLSELHMSNKNGNGNGSSSSRLKQHQHSNDDQKLPAAAPNSMALMHTKSCGETENPHIKRGIKGFVEFPKVVRAIGCRSSKHLGSKLECQKAQLKILLKQKGPVRFSGLIAR